MISGIVSPFFIHEITEEALQKSNQDLSTELKEIAKNTGSEKLIQINENNGSSDQEMSLEEYYQKLAKENIKTVNFWFYFLSIVIAISFGQLFLNYFKVFCLLYYNDKTATNFSPVSTVS